MQVGSACRTGLLVSLGYDTNGMIAKEMLFVLRLQLTTIPAPLIIKPLSLPYSRALQATQAFIPFNVRDSAMPSTYREIISEDEFFRTAYAMVAFASIFILARIGIQVWMRRAMEMQDYLLYLASAFFLTMSICYLAIMPKTYQISKVQVGQMVPWPTIQSDIIIYVRYIFATTTLFWLALWSVKLSLLALYKKLLQGLPSVWTRLWWSVFAFCMIVSLPRCLLFQPQLKALM